MILLEMLPVAYWNFKKEVSDSMRLNCHLGQCVPLAWIAKSLGIGTKWWWWWIDSSLHMVSDHLFLWFKKRSQGIGVSLALFISIFTRPGKEEMLQLEWYTSLDCDYILFTEEQEHLNNVYVFPDFKKLLKILVLMHCILLFSSKVLQNLSGMAVLKIKA